jgi:hypothetical protein
MSSTKEPYLKEQAYITQEYVFLILNKEGVSVP